MVFQLLAAVTKKMHGGVASDAEKIMQSHKLSIDVIIFSGIFNDWFVGDRRFRPHGADGGKDVAMAAAASICCGGENGGAKSGGLRAGGGLDFHAENVCVNLHEKRIFEGDAAASDDVVNRKAVLIEVVDDFPCAEGGGFNESAVDMLRPRSECHADEQTRQPHVVDARLVAIPPVECDKSRVARRIDSGEFRKIGVDGQTVPPCLYCVFFW